MSELAQTGGWVRIAFTHDPKAVRYSVKGDKGTVTAPGTACVSAPCSSAAKAKAAPWAVQVKKTLALTMVWKGGKWHPGPVGWTDPPAR